MAGTKVELTGASKYKSDLKAIADQAKVLASEMKVVQSSFTSTTTAQQKHEASSETLQKQIENEKNRIETLNAAIAEEMAQENANQSVIAKLTVERNNAQAALNNMENSINGVSDAEDEASGSTENFGSILKANLTSEAIVSAIEAIASKIKEVASSIKEAYTETVQWADDLATLSTVTGVSTEALQEYEYMADLMDVDVDTITSSLTKLTRNMESASDGTGTAAEAFAELGISVTDSEGQLRNNQEVFTEVIDALSQIDNQTQRDALAMEIFGKSAQELNPMIAAGSESMAEWAAEAHEMGYVLEGEALSGLLDSADASARLLNQTNALKRNLSAQLAPAISEMTNKLLAFAASIDWEAIGEKAQNFIDKMTALGQWFSDHGDIIISVLAGIGAGFAVFEMVTLIQGVVTALTAFKAAQEAASVAQAVLNAVMNANPLGLIVTAIGVVVAAVVLLVQHWEEVKTALLKVWEAIKTGVTDAFNAVKEKVTEWVTIGAMLVEGLWNGIKSKVQWIKDKIAGFVDDVLAWFKSFFGIASPSKETAWMGEMMMEGFAKGMLQNSGVVTSAWRNATGGLGIDTNNVGVSGSGGCNVVNIYPQSLDESAIDYIYSRLNSRMGVMA